MKYLIDTHVCLWSVAEMHKLTQRVVEILEDADNEILYSQISLLEIAIKFQVGKLSHFDISLENFNDTLQQKEFTLLALMENHLFAYFDSTHFSNEHRDPFDRCLLAIAEVEQGLSLQKM